MGVGVCVWGGGGRWGGGGSTTLSQGMGINPPDATLSHRTTDSTMRWVKFGSFLRHPSYSGDRSDKTTQADLNLALKRSQSGLESGSVSLCLIIIKLYVYQPIV